MSELVPKFKNYQIYDPITIITNSSIYLFLRLTFKVKYLPNLFQRFTNPYLHTSHWSRN